MKFLSRLFFFLCLPGIIWYAPLKAEISPTFSVTEDYSNFSPWDLLKYETLSFDRILDFVDMIENTDNLEEIFTEAQMEEIEEFLVFLMRNGIRDWDIEAKEQLEEDIAWMRGEPNNSSLADDEEEELPYWMSSFNDYHGMKILPAVLVPSKKSEIILCKGKLKKVYKNVKRAVKKHKKEIIVAAVVVVVAMVVIVATVGTSPPEAIGGGAAVIAGASDSKKKKDKDDDTTIQDNPRDIINKPGEVYCRNDYEQPISPESSYQNNTSVDRDSYHPHLEEAPKLRISDTTKEVVLKQTAEIKEELAEVVPDEAFNVMENEKPMFWREAKDKARETGSHIAHKVYDAVTDQLSIVSEVSGAFTEKLPAVIKDKSPFEKDPTES